KRISEINLFMLSRLQDGKILCSPLFVSTDSIERRKHLLKINIFAHINAIQPRLYSNVLTEPFPDSRKCVADILFIEANHIGESLTARIPWSVQLSDIIKVGMRSS